MKPLFSDVRRIDEPGKPPARDSLLSALMALLQRTEERLEACEAQNARLEDEISSLRLDAEDRAQQVTLFQNG